MYVATLSPVLSYVCNEYVLVMPCFFLHGLQDKSPRWSFISPEDQRPEGDMNDHRDMLQMYVTPPFHVVEAHAMAAKLGSRYSEQFKGLHQFCN